MKSQHDDLQLSHVIISAQRLWKELIQNYRKLLRRKRESFWSTKVISQKNSPLDLWRSIDAIMCRGKVPPQTAISAESLRRGFEAKVAAMISATSGFPPPSFSSVPSGCCLGSFLKVDEDSIVTIIRNLPSKSSECDSMHISLLKDCLDLLLPFLCKLFNLSLSLGVFPNCWKRTIIVKPIMKKGKSYFFDFNSYRPISHLCILSKILEKIVSSQVRSYLTLHDLIPAEQSAYRPFHSTETSILKLSADVLSSLDKGNVSLLCFLDLSSAFDSVNHQTLLSRLQISFGFEGQVLNWFNSFLSDRIQTVSFLGLVSSPSVIKCSVPQGSVLGPLLFMLYVSDIISVVHNDKLCIHMFADDLQVYGFCPPSKTTDLSTQMSSCLDNVIFWCSSNSLKLNAEKSEVMWCSSKQMKRSFAQCQVRLDNSTLSPVSVVKCLGVHLDCNLSFSSHVSKTVSACFAMLRQIRSVSRSLPLFVTVTLVTSLVLSRVDYCLSALFGIPECQIRRLQNIHHASARLIFGTSRFSSVTPLLKELKWLPIKTRIDQRLCSRAQVPPR